MGGIVTLPGVRVQIRPVLGVTLPVRATEPEKLPLAATVIVEAAGAPALTVTLIGLALRLMPGTIGLIIVAATMVELVIRF